MAPTLSTSFAVRTLIFFATRIAGSYRWNSGFGGVEEDGNFEYFWTMLIGGGNDELGTYVVGSFDDLESAYMLHGYAPDVEIWLTNMGFSRNDIPPEQNPYAP